MENLSPEHAEISRLSSEAIIARFAANVLKRLVEIATPDKPEDE